jgi:photosystem I subunit 11|tara:strand:- start:15462 stop:15902 length:441 start_codon:yes stop_codon:yes gene_type:complete
MANFIKPYNNDPFVGHLSTPITSSAVTKTILGNLPAYRSQLTPLLRGLEVGLAHGYFLIGPFTYLGPLRNSDIALLAGFLSNIGLILILTLALTIYGYATFQNDKSNGTELQSKLGWEQFKSGFLIGACGSSVFAYICLLNVPNIY